MLRPLWERKAALAQLLVPVKTTVLNVSYLEGAGEQM
jgi:hypothetical protein